MFPMLEMANARGVKIFLIYGKQVETFEELRKLGELENVAIFYLKNLHAKCYGHETKTIITSLNMLNYNMEGNREVGIILDQNEDKEAFEDARLEMIRMFSSSLAFHVSKEVADYMITLQEKFSDERMRPVMAKDLISESVKTLKTKIPSKEISKKKNPKSGFCLRCGEDIVFNPSRPMCRECYYEWADYSNYYYDEHYCHKCGEDADTTMAKPLCYDCYSN